jgi:hypothetical protein
MKDKDCQIELSMSFLTNYYTTQHIVTGPVVAGITEVETLSSDEIMQLLHR